MQTEWQQRLISGGRSGLSGTERDLVAGFAARIQKGDQLTPFEENLAKVLAGHCGKTSAKVQRIRYPKVSLNPVYIQEPTGESTRI